MKKNSEFIKLKREITKKNWIIGVLIVAFLFSIFLNEKLHDTVKYYMEGYRNPEISCIRGMGWQPEGTCYVGGEALTRTELKSKIESVFPNSILVSKTEFDTYSGKMISDCEKGLVGINSISLISPLVKDDKSPYNQDLLFNSIYNGEGKYSNIYRVGIGGSYKTIEIAEPNANEQYSYTGDKTNLIGTWNTEEKKCIYHAK